LARLEEALAWWRAGATPLGPAGRPADVQPPGGALWLASGVVAALAQLVRSAAVGLRFCYFFTAATAIYLLLRQDVDEKELDEIYEPS
jgi:hypothetical protein